MANESITAAKGFKVGAVKAGIKKSGNLDLGLIVADKVCAAAAVFTTNKVVGASVVASKANVRNGKVQAVYVNSGNANTCTGARGEKDVQRICKQVAKETGVDAGDVLVCSTGVIGHFLPMEKVTAGITAAAGTLSDSEAAGNEFARAIMTTDLVEKVACERIKIGGKTIVICGTAKGSGMIAPNMATMLAFITTDMAITSSLLKKALKEVAGQTFNKVTVDNHQSTSDTAIVMASGEAGNELIRCECDEYQRFLKGLHSVCDQLARKMAADGEGANCAVTVKVNGAKTAKDARLALRAIVDSPLVRTAFNGGDPNWGRIVSAVGYSGAMFDVNDVVCKIAGVTVFRNGRPSKFDAAKLSAKMKSPEWVVEVEMGAGKYSDFCYTCDLSREYVTINADYHT